MDNHTPWPLGRAVLLLMLCLTATTVRGQVVSIKNNLLYDATLTPNLGVEWKLNKRNTAQVFYGLNPWKYGDNKQFRHWSVMPEWRHWRRQAFRGGFWGLHAFGGEYNIGGVGPLHYIRHHHLEGSIYGAGVTFGHAWRIDPHWNLEAAIGLGYAHTAYDRYENIECGRKLGREHRNLVGPTKLALNLAWLIGRQKPKQTAAPVEPVVVVPPVIAEPQPATAAVEVAAPKRRVVRTTRQLNGRAFLDFPVNRTVIERSYRRNQAELDTVINTINVVRNDTTVVITHIGIHGYASPEGSLANNTRLAQERAQAFKEYIRSIILLPDSVFSVSSTPEDWDGLLRALPQHEELQHAAEIEQLIRQAGPDADPDRLEWQIRKRYPADYAIILRDIYPALRHSDYEVTYTIDEIVEEEE